MVCTYDQVSSLAGSAGSRPPQTVHLVKIPLSSFHEVNGTTGTNHKYCVHPSHLRTRLTRSQHRQAIDQKRVIQPGVWPLLHAFAMAVPHGCSVGRYNTLLCLYRKDFLQTLPPTCRNVLNNCLKPHPYSSQCRCIYIHPTYTPFLLTHQQVVPAMQCFSSPHDNHR